MQFDYSTTATRPAWLELPAGVRSAIEVQVAEPVHNVALAAGGFTPGFAATINSAWFVKAAPSGIPWMFASYSREAAIAAALPAGVPAPHLISARQVPVGAQNWQLLFFEAVPGRNPGQPWTMDDLQTVEAAILSTERAFRSNLTGIKATPVIEAYTGTPSLGQVFNAPLPSFTPKLSLASCVELRELFELAPEVMAGESLQHNDLRPDNILIAADRAAADRAVFCDWNYLAWGPRWTDWLVMLCYARAAGLSVNRLLSESELSQGARPDHLDSWLSTLAAYMLDAGMKPELPDSPRLRAHQRFSAYMLLDWLIERRELV